MVNRELADDEWNALALHLLVWVSQDEFALNAGDDVTLEGSEGFEVLFDGQVVSKA